MTPVFKVLATCTVGSPPDARMYHKGDEISDLDIESWQLPADKVAGVVSRLRDHGMIEAIHPAVVPAPAEPAVPPAPEPAPVTAHPDSVAPAPAQNETGA